VEAIEVAGLVVHRDTVSHPLLGVAHVIEHAERPITAMSAIDWQRPTEIPTIAEPRALPRGSGTLLMNEIASRAQAAGVQKLRYAGPYPTHALFASLLRSFRTTGTVEAFTADVLDRAVRIARDEVPVDFTPAPFVRDGDVDVRDGQVDRIRIAGVTYDRVGEQGSLALLEGSRAIISVGIPVAHIATLEGTRVVDGPHPLPSFPAPPSAFPEALRHTLADAARDFVPAPLAQDVARCIRASTITWADLGVRAARRTDGGFALHSAFLALAGHDMALFARQLSYHLAMIAQQTVLEELLAARRR
jgi:hypothetical protein